MKLIKIFSVLVLLSLSSCSYFQHQKHDKKSDVVLEEKPIIQEEKKYIEGTDDIPLFASLKLIEDDSSSFDTMVGTIIISKYSSESKAELIKKFYLEALPQLGWKLSDNTSTIVSFTRESDKLEIRFSSSSAPQETYVRFFISSIL
ncbi:MAG: hypothetical protein ACJA02_000997 [Myxococcota bacterium]|jgi:hypothetical protein